MYRFEQTCFFNSASCCSAVVTIPPIPHQVQKLLQLRPLSLSSVAFVFFLFSGFQVRKLRAVVEREEEELEVLNEFMAQVCVVMCDSRNVRTSHTYFAPMWP